MPWKEICSLSSMRPTPHPADPVTGQAAWFDLRVAIRKADGPAESAPQFAPLPFTTTAQGPLRYGAELRRASAKDTP